MTSIDDAAAERLLAVLEGFGEGEESARAEMTAAIEHVLTTTTACRCQESFCASRNGAETIRKAVRAALADPVGALAGYAEQVRAEHRDDLIDHLRAYPNVRVAANGSWVGGERAEVDG